MPKPTPETAPYWEALRRHELRVQRCDDCGEAFFYPRNVCPACLSDRLTWVPASGRGRLHSFTIVHAGIATPPLPLPYVVAIVELDEGPRLMSNLVGVDPDPEALSCDMPVEIEFADVTDEVTLPRFRPVGEC